MKTSVPAKSPEPEGRPARRRPATARRRWAGAAVALALPFAGVVAAEPAQAAWSGCVVPDRGTGVTPPFLDSSTFPGRRQACAQVYLERVDSTRYWVSWYVQDLFNYAGTTDKGCAFIGYKHRNWTGWLYLQADCVSSNDNIRSGYMLWNVPTNGYSEDYQWHLFVTRKSGDVTTGPTSHLPFIPYWMTYPVCRFCG